MADYHEFIEKMGSKIKVEIRKKRRLYFQEKNDDILEVVDYLFNKMKCRLSTATATETYHGIEALYHFSDDNTGNYYCPRVVMKDKKNPEMNSITPMIKGAEWIEREMAEWWGIKFIGHPRPIPLLSRNHPENLNNPMRCRR